MKVFIVLYYFFRSLLLRGPLAHFKLVYSELRYEKFFNIQTAGFKKSNSTDYFHYQGAAYKVLFRVLKELYPLSSSFGFIDIGCGMGRVLFVAEFLGYNELKGIEIDTGLIQQAEANLKKYPFKRSESTFEIVPSNALGYNYANKPSVYFLFNPFNEYVLSEVLSKILSSTKEETYFVYMNPMFQEAFSNASIPLFKTCKTFLYTEAIIYRLPAKE